MTQFIIRRLLLVLPVLIGILVVTFIITRAVPGDPCFVMLGERATEEACEDFDRRYGLDRSIPEQFLRYMMNIAQGNFGVSIKDRRPITTIISERLPLTFELTIMAMLFASVFGIILGVYSALHRNSFADSLTMLGANMGVSMPVFWLGLLLAYFFALVLKDTPFALPSSHRLSSGMSLVPLAKVWGLEDLTGVKAFLLALVSNSAILNGLLTRNFELVRDALRHLILPVITGALGWVAWYSRFVRSSMLDVIHQDYLRTARAKGLPERRVIFRHALRNAIIPLVTLFALDLPYLFGGTVFVEMIFAWPGMGRLFYDHVSRSDTPVVMGILMMIAVAVIIFQILTDIAYAWLDPRIRFD